MRSGCHWSPQDAASAWCRIGRYSLAVQNFEEARWQLLRTKSRCMMPTFQIHPGTGGADAATFAVELGAAINRATNAVVVTFERVVSIEVTAQL